MFEKYLCNRVLSGVYLLCCLTVLLGACRQDQSSGNVAFYKRSVSVSLKPLINAAIFKAKDDPAAAIPLYEKALAAAKRHKDEVAQVKSYRMLVFYYSIYKNDFTHAIALSDASILLAKKINDPGTYSDLYASRAVAYSVAGKLNEAADASTTALQYLQQDKAPDSLKNFPLYNNLAVLHTQLGNYKLAVENANKFLKHYTTLKDTARMIGAYQTMSNAYYQANDTVNFRITARRAQALQRAYPDKTKEYIVNSLMVAMYKSIKDYDSAKVVARQMINSDSNMNTPRYFETLTQMMEIADHANDTAYAASILKRGIPMQQLLDENLLPLSLRKNVFDGYYKMLKMTGNKELAQVCVEQAYRLAGELRKQEINKDLEKYEIERKKVMQENVLLSKDLQLTRKSNTITILIMSAGLLALAGTAFLVSYRRKMQIEKNRFELLEKEQQWKQSKAVLEMQLVERTRIAQELHDDLGASLTSIALSTELLKRKHPQRDTREISIIADNSAQLIDQMNQIVWTLNNNNDTLQSLLAYIRKFATGFLNDAGIHFTMHLPQPIAEHILDGSVRRNLFLTVKEGLHNIVKHAQATSVTLKVTITNTKQLILHLADNGKGMTDKREEMVLGNGLRNMKANMQTIGGTIIWLNNPSGGMGITVTYLLKT
ncbi:tetratricopeptide repeat-containing sensor histidine kinase [Pedobacter sp. N23S346]|uniref:tetratricopeptide repeat-containing sensor histidine kinase n=1 Tax=Pedobacter sp. N23S346 TaxID=3402750 RepID=UPI003AD3B7B0